ncbi:hypothetical protein HOE22_07870 [Candidatus Woesearchaeota archaeon]|jgi:hypothetical protein|nr:hypothetical protein [Candidatus Woesearchaeota archaeon]MBT4733079.1 hypothetical protein [Candidatus Woesearchaeota archaeon]
MIKVYISDKKIDGLRYLPLLSPFFGHKKNENRLFADKAQEAFTEPVFDLVKNIEDADFILFPYEFFLTEDRGHHDYLKYHIDLSAKYNKKLLIFDLSDFDKREINVPNSYVFRVGGFDFRRKENEFIMPFFVEDLSIYTDIKYKAKTNIPVIGFCGLAGLRGFKQKLKFYVKNIAINIGVFITQNKTLLAHKNGIYFRIKVIRSLRKCEGIKINFVIRKFYSSHISTIKLPKEEIRRQYIENLQDSNFALCVRGEANASYRFYEALSLGRVPFVITTNSIWPLENEIDYSKFSLMIDFNNLDEACTRIVDFYENMSNEEFIQMQKNAREVFETHLSVKGFLQNTLPKLIK